MIISQLLDLGSKTLRNNKVQTHKLDAELVLSNLLKKERENLIINYDKKVSKNIVNSFNKLINRRSTKEPLAYILKNKEFWSKNFFVNKNTLIPRPETELLCENIIKIFYNKNPYILDIGTGTGCILLSILSDIKNAKGIGVDISSKAVAVAKKNSNNLGLNSRVKFFTSSLDDIKNYKFDLIVSNPPYIKTSDIKNLSDDVRKFEPKIALDGGKDGLDVIKKIIYKSKTILKKFGLLALEIGYGQHYKVSQILKEQGFKEDLLVKDYRDNTRCIFAKFKN
ncbi:peptide chain release factor N(5)-glutamine methyltransferase [Pelagibacteraceae bacterium]|nr:peptide chain release factor N(5)-glutamine methyltransferase [Pelagibacteraceae bacterium]